MKTFLTLLVSSTTLSAAFGLPAWSAVQAPNSAPGPVAAFSNGAAEPMPILLANGGDDDHRWLEFSGREHDDEDDDEDCDERDEAEDDEENEDDGCRGGTRNPAPVGTVTPPQNGLFGNGAAPQVRVN